ncbi:MAG: hypothetical protein ACOZAQ_08930 [Pseudomonadota bacterium]
MNMKTSAAALALLLILGPLGARADMVVVTGARSTIETLAREDVVNIFMGRYRSFPNGQPALPMERASDTPEYRRFYQSLLNKRPEEIHAYWARLRFSGRTEPPRLFPGSREAYLREIAETPGAIGYTDRQDLPRDMRVLLTLPE